MGTMITLVALSITASAGVQNVPHTPSVCSAVAKPTGLSTVRNTIAGSAARRASMTTSTTTCQTRWIFLAQSSVRSLMSRHRTDNLV